MMATMGVSSDAIDECLNHKIASRVTRVYIRDRRVEEQIVAFDKLGAKLESLKIPEEFLANSWVSYPVEEQQK